MAEVATLSVLLKARDQLSGPLGKMSGRLDRLGAQAKKMGLAFTVMGGAITGALGASLKNFVTMGDEIQKMALRTGFGTEALSEMAFALKIAGSDIQSFEKGIKRMSSFVLDARDGLSTSTDALDRLGISVAQLKGLSPEKAFDVLSQAIAAVPDELEKAALAQDVFGRAGTSLLPLLKEGAKGITALRKEARELGVVFDQQAANAAAKLSDTMTRLKASLTGVSLTIGAALAPALEAAVKKITAVVMKVREWTQEHPQLTKFIALAAAAVGGLLLVLGPMLLLLPALAAGVGVVAVAVGVLQVAVVGLTGPLGLALAAVALLTAALAPKLLKNLKVATGGAEDFGSALDDMTKKTKIARIEQLHKALSDVNKEIADAKIDTFGEAFKNLAFGASVSVGKLRDRAEQLRGEIELLGKSVRDTDARFKFMGTNVRGELTEITGAAAETASAWVSSFDTVLAQLNELGIRYEDTWASATKAAKQSMDDQALFNGMLADNALATRRRVLEGTVGLNAIELADFRALQDAKTVIMGAGLSELEKLVSESNKRIRDANQLAALKASGTLNQIQRALLLGAHIGGGVLTSRSLPLSGGGGNTGGGGSTTTNNTFNINVEGSIIDAERVLGEMILDLTGSGGLAGLFQDE